MTEDSHPPRSRRHWLRIPAVLDRADITVIVDTREQLPLRLEGFRTKVAGLDTGDYSIEGIEHLVRLERKSLPDLVGCCGGERDRFIRELVRLRAFPHRSVVVEADWRELAAGGWRGSVSPKTVTASIASWAAEYAIPFALVGDRAGAEEYVSSFLLAVARHRHAELLAMASPLEKESEWSQPSRTF